MFSIDRSSSVPLYRQVAEHLRARILDETFAPGSALTSERAMMAEYGLSRVAVRLATDLLTRDGLVVRHRGKGTYVAQSRVKHELTRNLALTGFYDALIKHGGEARFELRAFKVTKPALDGNAVLPYETVVHLERAFMAGGETIIYALSELHPQAKRLSREDAEATLNYELLTDMLGFTIERTDIAIRAELPSRKIATALHVKAAEPVLVLRRATTATGGIGIERTVFYMRSDRYEFAMSVREDGANDQSIRVVTPSSSRGRRRTSP